MDLSSISKKRRRRRQHVAFVTLENKENSRGGVKNAHTERERETQYKMQTNKLLQRRASSSPTLEFSFPFPVREMHLPMFSCCWVFDVRWRGGEVAE